MSVRKDIYGVVVEPTWKRALGNAGDDTVVITELEGD